MPLPNWAIPFKEPHTEIKHVNGAYYKCQVSYAYDPDKKRAVKKSGALLGKITETGFVSFPKYQLRQAPLLPARRSAPRRKRRVDAGSQEFVALRA
jgi:hypothetical protein